MEVSVLVVILAILSLLFYCLGAIMFYIFLKAYLDNGLMNRILCILLSVFWFLVLIYALGNGNISIKR